MKQIRKYNWKPSPKEARGSHGLHAMPRVNHLKLAAAPLPASVDNSGLLPEVLDQGGHGSCVGHGTAEAIWGELVRESRASGGTLAPECPSRLWNYWLGRVLDGDPSEDNGTYVSSVFAMLAKYGFIPESAWPYSQADASIVPPSKRIPVLQKLAYKQRLVTGTARITSFGSQLITDIKTALVSGYLVTFGTQVDMAFENLGPTDVWPGCKGQSLGGHCMLITGYRTVNGRTQWRVRNSWGPGWCDGGSCWMDQAATDGFDDIWLVSSAPMYGLVRRVLNALRGSTAAATFVLALSALSIGAKGCGGFPDPGGTGGSLNAGGSPAIGGFVGTGGAPADASPGVGGAVVDSGPAPCATLCCSTCTALSAHGCEEGVPFEECQTTCLNAEDGPDLLIWPKVPATATLVQIRKFYECTGGQ
jgi:hypothetical protein